MCYSVVTLVATDSSIILWFLRNLQLLTGV